MRPRSFAYYRPSDLGSAVGLLHADALILNGGQAIIPALRMRRENPGALIDIKGIIELSDTAEIGEERITIGPRITVEKFINMPDVRERVPVLYEAGLRLGDAQIRSQGTVTGSMCWADPRANYPVALLACDAVIKARSDNGVRTIPAASFFAGFRANVLRREIVTSVDLPGHRYLGMSTYREFSRQTNDLCLVNIALVELKGQFRIAAGGLGRIPHLLPNVAALLDRSDGPLSRDVILEALVEEGLTPLQDPFGTPEYKLNVAASLVAGASIDIARGRS